ncbi:GIY-YIG nuclease family protein [Pontibacter akesuensis]|uniref:Putative endonuclease n=1 Tax=Pontibacter akesuensis TaxID=388950 RepID=A0A1I7H439_9BACT|nr:GIY-YIG nuclease family protein [Pontibacter akesuensis]GHA53553.1 excinuclease ABC subunit C [Pontibacter akesuensis]SFU55458.1 putative endonuclease [Pontibacter akesuensis]
MASHNYFTYITTNPRKTTLYVGVTNDIIRRLDEHFKNCGNPSSFAGKYYCYNLVYYERHSQINHAVEREKEIKKWSRSKKEALIYSMNPFWQFLNLKVQDE